jgi:membrane protein DedA with SNARE-associated domain
MDIFYALLSRLDYFTIFLLMMVESTFIPFPSEVVVPPAAYLAAGGELNVFLVVVSATLGAVVGALINYALAYFLGRPVIYRLANSRFGRLCLLSQEKVEKSERYFNRHGGVATFTGRLVPGIRQLISLPAGLAKMKLWKFVLYTALGAGAWNCVLAALGWYLHGFVPEEALQATINQYSEHIKLVILAMLVVAVVWFVGRRMVRQRA